MLGYTRHNYRFIFDSLVKIYTKAQSQGCAF